MTGQTGRIPVRIRPSGMDQGRWRSGSSDAIGPTAYISGGCWNLSLAPGTTCRPRDPWVEALAVCGRGAGSTRRTGKAKSNFNSLGVISLSSGLEPFGGPSRVRVSTTVTAFCRSGRRYVDKGEHVHIGVSCVHWFTSRYEHEWHTRRDAVAKATLLPR